MVIETDVCIVGAGPVGLFSAFAVGQAGFRTAIMDALPGVGGQCAALYPEKPIYDIPSRKAVTGAELVDQLKDQAAPYDPTYVMGQKAVSIDGDSAGGFVVTGGGGAQIAARAVLLSLGGGAFKPNRPPIADIERYERTSIFYAVESRAKLCGRRIVIAGGGDSAVDWALSLAHDADVTLVHRRTDFRAAPASIATLHRAIESQRVTLVAPYQLSSLVGDGDNLSAVGVKRIGGDSDEEFLSADVLLAFFGLATDLSGAKQWGIDIRGSGIEVDPATMSTSRPGVFAVGDIASYPGKQKLILTGFSEAACASHGIRSYIYPDKVFHFEHSTTRGRPEAFASQQGIQ